MSIERWRQRIHEGEMSKQNKNKKWPGIFVSKELPVQIQVAGPVGGRDSGLSPQSLTPGLSLLPRVRQQKPGQCTELLSPQQIKEVTLNEEKIKACKFWQNGG